MKDVNKKFIGLTGTTCVGKSAVAVELAKRLNTFVVSADSMQVYKGMDVGTAKITAEEMQGVPHFMLDVVPPDVNFSAFDYVSRTTKLIHEAQTIPIVCGGTGFYFDSLLFPSEFDVADSKRREELKQILKQPDGIETLVGILRKIDSKTAEKIDLKNSVRVMRAIEIAESGGSMADGVGRKREPQFDCKIFVLQRNREELYKMIDSRVEKMVANGLFGEVKKLIDEYGYLDTTAFAAIGYKEVIECIKGQCSEQEAVEKIKINTRHYAKRQITYFKRLPSTVFVDVDNKNVTEIADEIAKIAGDFCVIE